MLDITDALTRSNLSPTWTVTREKQLKKMWDEGYSARIIAHELGGFEHCADGGRSAICGKIFRLRRDQNLTQPKKKGKTFNSLTREEKAVRQRDLANQRAVLNGIRSRLQRLGEPNKALPTQPGAPSEFLALTFNEVSGNGLCMYARGEGAAMRFCGQPVRAYGHSWCATCHAIVYVKPADRNISPEGRERMREAAVRMNARRHRQTGGSQSGSAR